MRPSGPEPHFDFRQALLYGLHSADFSFGSRCFIDSGRRARAVGNSGRVAGRAAGDGAREFAAADNAGSSAGSNAAAEPNTAAEPDRAAGGLVEHGATSAERGPVRFIECAASAKHAGDKGAAAGAREAGAGGRREAARAGRGADVQRAVECQRGTHDIEAEISAVL